MATNPSALPENVGRITAPDANYPYGSAKNDSTGTTGDGTPIRAPWMNDWFGFSQAMLTRAGIVPSGNAETALVSQIADAVVAIAGALPFNAGRCGVRQSNAAAPTTSIDIGLVAVRDSADAANIRLAGTLTGIVQTSGSWAAGNNQNKLLVGARAANTSYHGFIISKSSDGTTDIAVHPSVDPSADLPADFDQWRRVCSFMTVAGGTIKRFKYTATECQFTNPLRDIDATGVGATTDLYFSGVPSGRPFRAVVQGFSRSTMGSAAVNVNTPGLDDVALYNAPTIVSPAANQTVGWGRLYVLTDSAAQIQIASSVAGNTYSAGAYGFVDDWENN